MRTLFDGTAIPELKNRLAQLQPNSSRQWGKMTPAQAVAHLSVSLEQALGDEKPSRMFLGHVFGKMAKRKMFTDAPMQRNAPTAPSLKVKDDKDLNAERARLNALLDRLSAGPSACTEHPHIFFGKLTPDEWGRLMYKHVDHHLQQFGV